MAEFRRSSLVAGLEARRSCQQNSCYRLHSHDAWSVGLIDEGTSVFAGQLDGTIRLEPGDVVVISFGQVHACNPEKGRWVYQMIHADQDWCESLAPSGASSPMFRGVRVLRQPALRTLVEAFSDAIFADESQESIEAAGRTLFEALESVPPIHLVTSQADPELISRLTPVMERLSSAESTPSLDELASLTGMSKYQLVRAMRRATGLTPMAWRQNVRIIQARHMLSDGHPIAETAHSLGFTDQSHFHRVFRSLVAASPGVYRD